MQLGRCGRAVQVPLGLDQLDHQALDHVPSKPGGDVGAGVATIGGVIYPAAGPAHTVKDTQQAKVGTNPKDRVSVLALAGDLGGAEPERDGGHDSDCRRGRGRRLEAHTELAIESMMVL